MSRRIGGSPINGSSVGVALRNPNMRFVAGLFAVAVAVGACSVPSDSEVGAANRVEDHLDPTTTSAAPTSSTAAETTTSAPATTSTAETSTTTSAPEMTTVPATTTVTATKTTTTTATATRTTTTSAAPAPPPPAPNFNLVPDCSLEPGACSPDGVIKVWNAPFYDVYDLNQNGTAGESVDLLCRGPSDGGAGDFSSFAQVALAGAMDRSQSDRGYVSIGPFSGNDLSQLKTCAPGSDPAGSF